MDGESHIGLLAEMNGMRLEKPNHASQGWDTERTMAERRTSAFEPKVIDIIVTRIMLGRCKGLPPEVVDCIFDYAEYWAHSTTAMQAIGMPQRNETPNQLMVRSLPLGFTTFRGKIGTRSITEERLYRSVEANSLPLQREHDPSFFAQLVDYPTPRLLHPCRKIVFTIRSHDQGWGGEPGAKGTYRSSWTWFEAGIERFDASQNCHIKCPSDLFGQWRLNSAPLPPLSICALRPVEPTIESVGSDDADRYQYVHELLPRDNFVIQRNKVATRDTQMHVVEWSWRDKTMPDSEAARELVEQGRGQATGDGTFVRQLRLGDVVTVWGKARFPGWESYLQSVRVDIYWLV